MSSAPTLFGPYWYVATVGLLLAVLGYVLMVRLVVDLLFPSAKASLSLRVVRRVSQPVVGLVGAISPRVVPAPMVVVCAIVWVYALRVTVVQVLAAMAMGRVFG